MDRCLTRLIEGTVRKKTKTNKVRYASKIELKYGMLVRYGSRYEVRSTQILNILYSTAILANDLPKQLYCI